MKRWITILAALVSTFAAFADEQKVHDLDITVTLDAKGVAQVREVWDVETGNNITEWYLPRENLGNIDVRDLRVRDAQFNGGQPFTDVGEWDVDLSRKQKAGKSGIVHKHNGVELCWGIGDFGHHVFEISYTMTNCVKTLSDADAFHMQLVNPGLVAPPRHVRVTIETDPKSVKAVLDTANTRIWGFGFYGESSYEGGKVVFESTEPFAHNSSVIALLRFDKGMFNSPAVEDRDFQQMLDRAMEGADFGSSDDDDSAAGLASLLALIAMFFSGWKGIRKATGKVSRWEKKRVLGVKENDVQWFRDIPMDGDLLAADYALTRLGYDRKRNALASAEILRMIYQGYLDVRKDAAGKVEITFAQDRYGKESVDSVGRDLWDMMLEASGSDRVLQDREFSSWSRKNKKRLYDWTEKVATRGKHIFRTNGWMDSRSTRITLAGQTEIQHLVGFGKFLNDFTLTGTRETVEAHLWQDYLVFGALLGIADKVAQQLKDIDPVLFEQTIGYDYTTFSGALHSMNGLSRAITNSSDRYLASKSGGSWGGFGGATSFGGGGGFSGGGFGGGGR